MKKLLTLAVVAATAGFAQAASLNWSALNIYQPGSTTEKLSGGAVYLFITEQSGNFGAGTTTVNDVKTLLETEGTEVVKNEGKVVGLKNGTTTIDVAAATATNASGGFSGATGYGPAAGFGAGDSLKAFAVIFDNADFASAGNYIVTDIKSASWTSSTGAKALAFGNQTGATWSPTAVPEPATAVLALAGLALLLKRRRA